MGTDYKDHQIVLFEYQRGRGHEHPKVFYKGFNGILLTDGLQQYPIVEEHLEGLKNANCRVHLRRFFSDAIKATGKTNKEIIKNTVACQALVRITAIYKLEKTLRDLTASESLAGRQGSIKPLVEESFAWAKERLEDNSVLPKGKTGDGLRYGINQEKYLKVFLEDGEVPIDNSASERALRTFCIGKKSWGLINSVHGVEVSAIIYSITETAKLNGLNPNYYLEHLLTVIPDILLPEKKMNHQKYRTGQSWRNCCPGQMNCRRNAGLSAAEKRRLLIPGRTIYHLREVTSIRLIPISE